MSEIQETRRVRLSNTLLRCFETAYAAAVLAVGALNIIAVTVRSPGRITSGSEFYWASERTRVVLTFGLFLFGGICIAFSDAVYQSRRFRKFAYLALGFFGVCLFSAADSNRRIYEKGRATPSTAHVVNPPAPNPDSPAERD
jgi:hypothetical protein